MHAVTPSFQTDTRDLDLDLPVDTEAFYQVRNVSSPIFLKNESL